MFGLVTIQDDRGRRVPAFNAEFRRAGGEHAAAARARKRVGERGWPVMTWPQKLVSCLLGGALGLGVPMTIQFSRSLIGNPWCYFVAVLPVLLFWWVQQWFSRHILRNRLKNEMLIELVCPSCAYSLSGLPRETDGCAVCAECGAAWNRLGPGVHR